MRQDTCVRVAIFEHYFLPSSLAFFGPLSGKDVVAVS